MCCIGHANPCRAVPRQVDDAELANVKAAIEVTLAAFSKPATAVRPKLTVPGASEDRQELLHTLMDTYVKNDVLSIQQSIVNRERAAGPPSTAAAGLSARRCSAAARASIPSCSAAHLGLLLRAVAQPPPQRHALLHSPGPPRRRGVHDGAVPLHV